MSSNDVVSVKPLACSMQFPQFLSIGDTQFHSGCAVIQILFPNMGSFKIGKITFANNYTAHLSVNMKVDETNSSGKTHSVWKVGIRKFPLMDNPHCECGSQSYFTLWPKDFCQPPLSVSALRFVLYQPSPSWKTFSLEEIHVYPMVSEDFVNPSIPRWLIQSLDDLSLSSSTNEPKPSDQAQIEGLPDPDDLSLKMQQLWMLAEKIQDSAPGIDLGRFDVDGCYEINLLSYT